MHKRQVLLAYTILFGVLCFFVVSIVRPLWSDFLTAQEYADGLKQDVVAFKKSLKAANIAQAELNHRLTSLALDGNISLANPDVTVHHFQMTVKSLLSQHGISLKQLVSTRNELTPDLFELSLELSFQASPQAIQSLLEDFTQVSSKARIGLFSLRNSVPDISGSTKLEGRLIVFTLSHGVSQLALPESTDQSFPKRANPYRLSTLFDPVARLRFNNPDTNYYRVAALTVSEQGRVAVLIDIASGNSIRVQEGDFLDAWRVDKIHTGRVLLSVGERSGELRLDK
jgi:hypothetical protein